MTVSTPVPDDDGGPTADPAPATEATSPPGLLSQQTMQSVLQGVAGRAVQVVLGATEASVTLIVRGRPNSIAWTGLLAFELDETQNELGDGPCLAAATSGRSQLISDMTTEVRWPGYTTTATRQGCLSSLSTPIPLGGDLLAGINLYAMEADAFDAQAETTAHALAEEAAVAITNMHDYERVLREAENLHTALASRAVIEQAKGILMARHGCGPDEAFQLLATQSQHGNRKLRELAAELVASTYQDPVEP